MPKITRKEWVELLLEEGMDEEEIFEALEKGSKEHQVNPCPAPFNKLQGKKILKQINES